MVKKKTSRTHKAKHVTVSPTHFMIKRSIISYAVLVFIFFATVSMSIYLIDRIVVAREHQVRYDRISKIYSDLQLGDSYRIAKVDIFGDQRVYSWDKDRTYSSSIEYGHNDDVSSTFADLKTKIEAAGFKQFDTPYDNSVAKQYHFKNDAGEYVRVSVVPSIYQNMVVYGTPSLEDWLTITDRNTGPSYVTIKVNLDDNNE